MSAVKFHFVLCNQAQLALNLMDRLALSLQSSWLSLPDAGVTDVSLSRHTQLLSDPLTRMSNLIGGEWCC